MLRFLTIFMLTFLTSCTVSLNIIHSQGVATDVVDEDQKPANTVSPNINLSGI